MEKIKVFVIGDAVVPTGFSRVLHSIMQYLPRDIYDISWLGINYYGDPHEYTYRIYPASNKMVGDLYGMSRLEDLLDSEKPNIIFLLNDVWVLDTYLQKIKSFYEGKENRPKIVTYFPVDAEDHDPEWYRHFDIVDKAVVYTQFAFDVVKKAVPYINFEILPHGIDHSIFFKIPESKKDIKSKLYPNRADFLDSFIVLNAGRNQPRKKLDVTMRGFKLFSEGKPENVKLYMHCGVKDSSMDIIKLAGRLEIDKRLILSSRSNGVQVLTNGRLNLVYNATDVGLNTSLGEGWSLPNCEHAVTGAPQVVANHSALRELYSDCGVLIPAETPIVLDNIMTTGYLCTPEDVAASLEEIYQDKGNYNKLSKKGLEKFTSDIYSWKNISKRWDNLLRSIL